MKILANENQIFIYISAILLGILSSYLLATNTSFLQVLILPFISILIYLSFVQIPFLALFSSLTNWRFLIALLIGNFIVIPLILFIFLSFTHLKSSSQFALILVLLSPCVDYVVIFSKLGGGNCKLMLISTPILLILQLVLLPLYLYLFLNQTITQLINLKPFICDFIFIILLPLLLAFLTQLIQQKISYLKKIQKKSESLCVLFLSIVLFLIFSSQFQLMISNANTNLFTAVLVYISFLIIMPVVAIYLGDFLKLKTAETRTLAFSFLTRNSLIILPIAFSLSGHLSIILSIIIAQICIELLGELIYIRLMPELII